MKLYHGSNVFIDKPDFLFSKPYKDFGLGFYLSDTYEKLQDVGTGFYYQSPGYVYAFLENELTTGKCC